MKDFEFIIRKGRFRIVFWDLFFIGIFLFGIMVFSLVFILYSESIYIKNIIIILSFVILIFVSLLYYKTLLNRISFHYYVNNTPKTIESIISEISLEYSLKLHKQDANVFHSFYFLPSRFWMFKRKKDVYFILCDNTIMINIRNSDETIVFNIFRDRKAKEIKKALSLKTGNK